VDYVHALHHTARRENPERLRAALAGVERSRRDAGTPKRQRRLARRERALRRRLEVADALADYDWAKGEAEFIDWARGGRQRPRGV
jgi:hypothetical protein